MTEYLEAGLFAVDHAARTIRGVLIPWGERSRLTMSKTKPLTFNRSDVPVPRDASIVGLNRMHDRFDPVGRAVEFVDEPVGMVAEFAIANTPEGDAYLAEPGNLRRLSPEVRNIRRRPDGTATAELTGAALVDEGAFQSAGLFAIDADPDEGDEDDAAEDENEETPDEATAPAETEPATPAEDEEEETDVSTEVPNTFAPGNSTKKNTMTAGAMFRAMSALATGRATPETIELMREHWGAGETGVFALNDIEYDGASGVGAQMTPGQWIGEVVDGSTYVQQFANLFGPHKPLTSLALGGWTWGVKPAGGPWTGNKDAIPSNTPTVVPASETASRWAGGHDHAREHIDFGTPGYFESYYAAMVESYFRWVDETIVLAGLEAAATQLEADNPAGLEIGAAMSKVIDGAVAVVTAGLIPTFAALPVADYKSILKTPNSAVLGYLNAALGFEAGELENAGFQFRPSALLTNPIVGSANAADVYELGGTPVRAEALNIANGGLDTGLFGYAGLHVKNAAAIVEVTPYTP
jgi:hypothetical protein